MLGESLRWESRLVPSDDKKSLRYDVCAWYSSSNAPWSKKNVRRHLWKRSRVCLDTHTHGSRLPPKELRSRSETADVTTADLLDQAYPASDYHREYFPRSGRCCADCFLPPWSEF